MRKRNLETLKARLEDMRRRRPKAFKAQLMALLPTALGTLVDLLACEDTEIRTQAQAWWHEYGPRMVEELERRQLRH